MEELIKLKKPYIIEFPSILHNGCCIAPSWNVSWEYKVFYEYWIDGFKFLMGTKSTSKNYPDSMVEFETGLYAVQDTISVQSIINKLKFNIQQSKKSIGEVIYKGKLRNGFYQLWEISLML